MRVAQLLVDKYGGTIERVPEIKWPQGIQTPDYLFDGVEYDLKTVKASGKNAIDTAVKNHRGQASRFVLDLTDSPLAESEEWREQVKNVMSSTHRQWIDQIVAIKENEVLGVFDRIK